MAATPGNAGRSGMTMLNSFIKSIEWWNLVPSGMNGMKTIIVDPVNTDTTASFVAAAAARDASFLVAYIPPGHNGAISVDVSVLSNPGFAYWFDPTDGQYIPVEASAVSNNGVRKFPPAENQAGESDWVLLITTGKMKD